MREAELAKWTAKQDEEEEGEKSDPSSFRSFIDEREHEPLSSPDPAASRKSALWNPVALLTPETAYPSGFSSGVFMNRSVLREREKKKDIDQLRLQADLHTSKGPGTLTRPCRST